MTLALILLGSRPIELHGTPGKSGENLLSIGVHLIGKHFPFGPIFAYHVQKFVEKMKTGGGAGHVHGEQGSCLLREQQEVDKGTAVF